MRIIGHKAIPVFDDDTFPIAPFVSREDNATRSGGIDLASIATCKVYPAMAFCLLRDRILPSPKRRADPIGLLSQRIK